MKLSVVIPFYNHWELTYPLLFDLYRYCRDIIYEVYLINNGSDDITVYNGLHWFKCQKFLPIKEYRISENCGFLKAANFGMMRASGNALILLSNDIRIHSDICTQVLQLLSSNKDILIGQKLVEFTFTSNIFGNNAFPYLERYFLSCTKKFWELLGGFDEIFSPNDMEDVDLSTKAIYLGYTLKTIRPNSVTHLGGRTIGYSEERNAIINTNTKKFIRKWRKIMYSDIY
jgi:GT2 family glycosyltransferase